MSLLTLTTPNSSPQLTTLQQTTNTVNSITNSVTALFNHMVKTYNDNYNAIWNNKYGLSPSLVCLGLGQNAQQVFNLGQLLANTVNSAASGTITNVGVPSGYTYSVGPSGTITISNV